MSIYTLDATYPGISYPFNSLKHYVLFNYGGVRALTIDTIVALPAVSVPLQ